jgi:hypothetical protein
MAGCQNKKHLIWFCNTMLSTGIQSVAVTHTCYSHVKPHQVASHMQDCNAYGRKSPLPSQEASPGRGDILTANVFPEPVWAIPTMSRPLMAIGQPWHWIAVGVSNPDFLQKCKHILIRMRIITGLTFFTYTKFGVSLQYDTQEFASFVCERLWQTRV